MVKFDKAQIIVEAGRGGDGLVHFRREKYVPRGGPDGGDGGDGGSVYLVGDASLNNLLHFRGKRYFKAEDGEDGKPKKMKGRTGRSVYVRVPLGTVVYDADTGEKLGEILHHGQKLLVAKGGKGGRGNVHFKTPVNRAPRIAEKGTEGERRKLLLELKHVADIGIVGFPNVGKSTLLNVLTGAKSKVGDYPFTTIVPHLGVVSDEFNVRRFVLVDIPGIVEGASLGKGLGYEFLRHIERTKVLLFLLDPTLMDVEQQYRKLLSELEAYNPSILDKRRIIVVNKMDIFKGNVPDSIDGIKVFKISALVGIGIDELRKHILSLNEIPSEN